MPFKDFMQHAETHFITHGFNVDKNISIEDFGVTAELHARISGRSAWLFFPYNDFYFLHDCTPYSMESPARIMELHERSREYVNSLFRLPKPLRYRVPNIVTVAVSERGFLAEIQEYAAERRNTFTGGERHSVFLVDLMNRRMVSQGLETTWSDMVAIRFKKVNPGNRAYHEISGLIQSYDS